MDPSEPTLFPNLLQIFFLSKCSVDVMMIFIGKNTYFGVDSIIRLQLSDQWKIFCYIFFSLSLESSEILVQVLVLVFNFFYLDPCKISRCSGAAALKEAW